MRTRRVFFLLLALVVSAVPLASVRGDLAADRIDSLQQDQEAMDGETARAIAAWARDAQATDSRTHLVEALDRCDDLLEQASSANTAAALGKRARTVAGKVAGHRRRLLKALASLDRDDARASTLRKALAACPKSSSRITRVLEKIPTAGPAVFLRDTDTREPWVVGPGETLRLTVWGLDGTGAACPAPQAAVSCPTPGVVNGPPVVTAGPPHSVSISCGNAPGVAEITIAACGIVRRAFVANLGTGEPLPPQPEVLAIVPTPTSLCTGGGWLCWSDATDQPVKTMPTTGGDVQAAAIRLVRPERLFAFDDGLLALDIRDGFSPGGGVGSGVIRALLRFDIPSGSCQTLHLAGNAAFAITTDVVVRDHCAWWVTGESSPDTYTIQCVPLDGSPPADAYTSPLQPITALAATQTHLYWTETAYPDPGTIRRLPLAGGPAEIVYISPIPLARVLATDTVGSGRLLFVDGGMPHSHRLKALPLAGGAPVELALLPAAPRRLAADGTHVCWIDAEAVYGIPAGGGAPVPIAAGPLGLTDLTLDGGDAFWTEYPGEAHGITGNVSKAPLDGGAVTVLAADVRSPAAVAVAGTDVYWSQAGPLAAIEHFAMIGSVPRDGGTIGVFAAGITALHAPVVADNQGIYVADGWTVKRLGFGPSAAQVLATTDDAVAGIALHDGTLVWIGGPFGIVFSVPTVGGTVSLLGAVNGYAGAVALDAAAAYAVGGLNEIHRFPRTGAGGGLLTSSGIVDALLPAAGETLCYADLAQNALYRIPTTGGTATWLAGILNSDWSCRLATDGPSLYWITPSMAAQVPVAGGNSTTLLQNLPADPGMVLPNSIAVDADGVYCAVVLGDGTGAILRIPRE